MELVIGERANRWGWRRRRHGGRLQPGEWVRIALRVGAFKDQSQPQNRVSYEKLKAIGADMTRCVSMNLCPPGRGDDHWPRGFAAAAAKVVRGMDLGDDKVLLLGRRVQEAFGIDRGVPYGTLIDGRFICLPHPSGLCRVWNDITEVEIIRAQVHMALSPEPRGRCCLCGHPCDRWSWCKTCKRYTCVRCAGVHEKAHLSLVG